MSVVDAKTLRVVKSFPAGVDPEGIAVDSRGRLYAAKENESALTIIDVADGRITKRHQIGLEPETAVLSPDENTANAEVAGKVTVGRNPRGMRFTADSSRLYVPCEQDHTVSVVDVAGLKQIQSLATGGERPVDIVLSPDNARVYVSHGRSEDVRVFEADTWKMIAAIPVGPRAWWMALTPDGRFL